ncbi:MAG: amidohydrolase family protein [Ignavibacteriaceae bacterium]|nr:amidohydrolase family protein [Ignavibacteriaceae bacterium]
MLHRLWIFVFAFFLTFQSVSAPQSIYPVNGPADVRDVTYALINGQVISSWDASPANLTVLVRNGKITAVGASVTVPADAVVIDCSGRFIYPAFLDVYSGYGLPAPQRQTQTSNRPKYERTSDKQSYWNEAIRSAFSGVGSFTVKEKEAEELRSLGFGAALPVYKDGIVRGTFPVVLLGSGHEVENILHPEAVSGYSFNKGTSLQSYPNSLIGAIALMRQFFYDADWYQKSGTEEYYQSLAIYNKTKSLPRFFEAEGWQNTLRIKKIADEFKMQFVVKGGGNEYQRIDEIKKTGFLYILPLNFPASFEVSNQYDAELIPFSLLKHWELAPFNPVRFAEQNIPFALTLDGLKDKKEFRRNLLKAVQYGLTPAHALRALTETPAKLIQAENQLGAVKSGYIANLIVTDGELFDENSSMLETWVAGKRYRHAEIPEYDLRGTFRISYLNNAINAEIKGKAAKPEVKLSGTTLIAKASLNSQLVTFRLNNAKGDTVYTLSGTFTDANSLKGTGTDASGSTFTWKAVRTADFVFTPSPAKPKPEAGSLIYPFEAYGKKELPASSGSLLIKNATVWTNEKDGILEQADILVENGRISKTGKNLSAPAGITVIDANGGHVTPGIIDEHTHIAITAGVNEGTQASSAEVRIEDAVNPDDINIYRQLSGGVTTVQQLHGSANQAGGQSSIIKMRWGNTAEGLKFKDAPASIKFALGENVKQSNWGDFANERYPQTRMGVEQYYFDLFTRAKEYAQRKKAGGNLFRVDLDLEAINEILEGKRNITCHSYVQSEINMLLHVADSMGFKVNTFTHILEGYKVADKMKQHGSNASSFSDWWAYKFEVYEAIPHNGAIMHNAGLNVGFNSDDAEMARRLNQEAAKAVKYGNISEEDALKFVTLNPAKMLKLDHKIGSIKTGKDADLVLWSGHPLSIASRAEKTIIDGIIYFDRDLNDKAAEEIKAERNRIIQKMQTAQKSGEPAVKPEIKKEMQYECDTLLDDYTTEGGF